MILSNFLALSLMAAPTAPAPTKVKAVQLIISLSDNKPRCEKREVAGVPGLSVQVDVAVKGTFKAKVNGVEEVTLLKPGESKPLKLPDGDPAVSVLVEDETGNKICDFPTLEVGTADAAGDKPAAENKPAKPFDPEMAKLVAAARVWMASRGITKHAVTSDRHRRKFVIYHTPDGYPAYPIPTDIEETDTIVLAVVVPRTGTARLAAQTCPKLKLGRVRGSFAEATEDAGHLRHGGEKGIAPVDWGLLEIAEFRCSDELEYTLSTFVPARIDGTDRVLTGEREITIAIDPVYFFTVGVALAFDFGKPGQVSLLKRPMMDGSENYVNMPRDYSGLKPLITVGVHPCGANPKRWRVCDMFTPTLALDPTRLLRGFGVGMNFSFTPWFGVLVGFNVYKSTVLQPGNGIKDGDVWTSAGDLPTKDVFNKDSVGGFVGINLTSDIIQAIRGKAAQ